LAQAKDSLAERLTPAVEALKQKEAEKLAALQAKQEQAKQAEANKAAAQRELQKQWQAKREAAEHDKQQERFNKGVRGVVDRVTGQRRKTKEVNALEAFRNAKRDEAQRDALIVEQKDQQQRLNAMREKALEKPQAVQQTLKSDVERLQALRERAQNTDKPRSVCEVHARNGPVR